VTTFAEFEPLKTLIDDRLDQGAERGSSARDDFRVVNFYFAEAIAKPHDQPAHPAIAHQQIGPRAEAQARRASAIRRRLRVHQLGFVLDGDEQVRGPANAKRRQLGQRHRAADSLAKFLAQLAFKRLHGF
jgi:hypothetical protein